jgi:hypothetical protein
MAWVFDASAVVVQTAWLLETVTELHPEIETPSVVKLTVPVAPEVMSAVSETETPANAETAGIVKLVVEEVPGLTKTLGFERGDRPRLFSACKDTK